MFDEEEMLDIVFVFSVRVLKLDDNFMKMKFVIIEIFGMYGLFIVCYSVIKFGKDLEVDFDFGDESDFEELR